MAQTVRHANDEGKIFLVFKYPFKLNVLFGSLPLTCFNYNPILPIVLIEIKRPTTNYLAFRAYMKDFHSITGDVFLPLLSNNPGQ